MGLSRMEISILSLPPTPDSTDQIPEFIMPQINPPLIYPIVIPKSSINPQQSSTQPTDPITAAAAAADSSNILLVDDNHINLKVLSAYMTKLGRSHKVVVNGKEALDKYTQNAACFTAILMDISMPVMDGFEATRRIRQFERDKHLPAVPIIALTGLASNAAHQEALESGINKFLTKPVRLKVLLELLNELSI